MRIQGGTAQLLKEKQTGTPERKLPQTVGGKKGAEKNSELDMERSSASDRHSLERNDDQEHKTKSEKTCVELESKEIHYRDGGTTSKDRS